VSDLDWLQALKVGDRVRIERSFAGGLVDHTRVSTVTRRTPKRAYLSRRTYVDLATGLVRPPYLDYTTAAVALVTDTDIDSNNRG